MTDSQENSKIICVGDLHIRGNNPRNRLGNYFSDAIEKLTEIVKISQEIQAAAILQTGDVFDTPNVSPFVLAKTAEVLNACHCPIYCAVGNHDIFGFNIDSFSRSSLMILELLVPNLHVVMPDLIYKIPNEKGTSISVASLPFCDKTDVDGFGYDSDVFAITKSTDNDYNGVNIMIAHGMLLKEKIPFEKYTLIENVATSANIVVCGHNHAGFGIVERHNSDSSVTFFTNPGALMRINVKKSEIYRCPQYTLLEIKDKSHIKATLQQLKCAKKPDEVLDLIGVEQANLQRAALDNFNEMLASLASAGDADSEAANTFTPEQIVQMFIDAEKLSPATAKKAFAILKQADDIINENA